jgi:GDPmannose 4,6-dehydratase
VKLSDFKVEYYDMCEPFNLERVLQKEQADEFYNLAAQSFVASSFDLPLYTFDVNAVGVCRILETIRQVNPKIKFYQASTSEMFGKVQNFPQNEKTPFYPRSPYFVAKLAAYWMSVNYRESYNMFVCNGILFNHESPLRGIEFVTKKIINHMYQVKKGVRETVRLGNIDSKRDWGHAEDYVEAMYLMMQHHTPDDYVVATGNVYTIRDFVESAGKFFNYTIEWEGEGVNTVGIDRLTGKKIIEIDPQFFRPTEVELLIGDSSKARDTLGWQPKHDLNSLIGDMVAIESSDKYHV